MYKQHHKTVKNLWIYLMRTIVTYNKKL